MYNFRLLFIYTAFNFSTLFCCIQLLFFTIYIIFLFFILSVYSLFISLQSFFLYFWTVFTFRLILFFYSECFLSTIGDWANAFGVENKLYVSVATNEWTNEWSKYLSRTEFSEWRRSSVYSRDRKREKFVGTTSVGTCKLGGESTHLLTLLSRPFNEIPEIFSLAAASSNI